MQQLTDSGRQVQKKLAELGRNAAVDMYRGFCKLAKARNNLQCNVKQDPLQAW
jgi:hypothetical protein